MGTSVIRYSMLDYLRSSVLARARSHKYFILLKKGPFLRDSESFYHRFDFCPCLVHISINGINL